MAKRKQIVIVAVSIITILPISVVLATNRDISNMDFASYIEIKGLVNGFEKDSIVLVGNGLERYLFNEISIMSHCYIFPISCFDKINDKSFVKEQKVYLLSNTRNYYELSKNISYINGVIQKSSKLDINNINIIKKLVKSSLVVKNEIEIEIFDITNNKNNLHNTDLLNYKIHTQNCIFEGNRIISNGNAGYAIYGPYLKTNIGDYICEAECILGNYNEAPDVVGFCDIYSDSNVYTYAKIDINKSDFRNNKLNIEIRTSLPYEIDDFEFRIYLYEGVIMQIGNLSINEI